MAQVSIKQQLIEALDHLTPNQQSYLLGLVHQLQHQSPPLGTDGKALLAAIDQFIFPPGAIEEMMQAIDKNCEEIDWDGWQ